jgi:serine/threonine protein kinase
MSGTTFLESTLTLAQGGKPLERLPMDMVRRYESMLAQNRISWTEHHKIVRQLGAGGQGVVFLAERRGADNFTVPLALKVFSPERYESATAYDRAMSRMARVAAEVAQIQQDNLLDVENFVDRGRIRVMEMEWIDGYDLSRLLTNETLHRTHERVSPKRWEYLNRVIVTAGPEQPRLKPGVAISIVGDCLAALAALHRTGIVHGDVKPANIMVKRTGTAKIIDIGSAFEIADPPQQRMCTPMAAAPEILEKRESTPRSDLASIGYVLIEMLSGRAPFTGLSSYSDLLEAKRTLPNRLHEFLPLELMASDHLVNFCRRLIAPDPQKRFPDAGTANLAPDGSANFLRQLVKGDMASEYDNEMRVWLEELE